jgi:hypothetical protein
MLTPAESPKTGYGKRHVLGAPWANPATTAVKLIGTSNKSECTRESTMPGACLVVSRNAHGGGEIDSTMRRCVPQPNRHRPNPLPCFVLRMANRGKI